MPAAQGCHPLFEGILRGFAAAQLAGAPAIVIRGRVPVVHLIEARSDLPACGNADEDDDVTTDYARVTCRSCQLAIPLPSAA